LDAQPPHAQGVGGQESFQGGATDIGTDGHPG
jgi:cell division protease FtsH